MNAKCKKICFKYSGKYFRLSEFSLEFFFVNEIFPEIYVWGNAQDVWLDICSVNQDCMLWNLMMNQDSEPSNYPEMPAFLAVGSNGPTGQKRTKCMYLCVCM